VGTYCTALFIFDQGRLLDLMLLLYNRVAMEKHFLPWVTLTVLVTFPLLGDVAPGRVSVVEGTAAVAYAGEEEWFEAGLNLPIYEADRLVLQEDSRIELEFDEGSFLRLGPKADVTVRRFAADGMDLEVLLGAVILRTTSAGWSVQTADLSLDLREPGLYRLDVDEAGGVRIAVRKGAAHVSGKMSAAVGAGQALAFQDPGRHWISQTYVKDEFDFWSDRRDARTVARQSAAQLGGSYGGVHELDRHGDWGYHAPYGMVWWPHVGLGWSPFRVGRWVHFSRWGWTWISHEPWGWLPYHRGRWAYVDSFARWCWVPGHFSTWSPAVVHFYFGKGHVGWAPRTPDGHWVGAELGRGIARTGFSLVREEDFARGVIQENRFVRPTPDLLSSLSRRAASPGVSTGGPTVTQIPRESPGLSRAGRAGSGVMVAPGVVGSPTAPANPNSGRFGARTAHPRIDRSSGQESGQTGVGAPAGGPAVRSPGRTAVPRYESGRLPSRSAPGVRQSSPSPRVQSPAPPTNRAHGRIAVPQGAGRSNSSGAGQQRMQNTRRAR
jgi:hypothetical protein